jgi:hypothetical protein
MVMQSKSGLQEYEIADCFATRVICPLQVIPMTDLRRSFRNIKKMIGREIDFKKRRHLKKIKKELAYLIDNV